MKKIVFILLLASLFSSVRVKAQHHEIGLFLGTMYYLGDLNPTQQFGMASYNFGLFYRYAVNPRIAVRIAAHYGKVQGDSEHNRDYLQYKNLSFHSILVDIDAGIEINFLPYEEGSKKHRFTPFVFGGIGVFHFNPKTYYMGTEYELQPLATEGQGLTKYPDVKPYSLTSWSIPFGVGLKWSVSKRVSFSLEWTMHKTFTDYIDDISTRFADASLISAERSPLSAALSIRQYEKEAIAQGLDISMGPNGQPVNEADYNTYLNDYLTRREGGQRGGLDKDWYSIAGLAITFNLASGRHGSCPAYRRRSHYKEYSLF